MNYINNVKKLLLFLPFATSSLQTSKITASLRIDKQGYIHYTGLVIRASNSFGNKRITTVN